MEGLFLAVGRALSTFDQTVQSLCNVFEAAMPVGHYDGLSSQLFYSVGFSQQIELTEVAVLFLALADKDLNEWYDHRRSLGDAYAVRNDLVHSAFRIFSDANGSKAVVHPDAHLQPTKLRRAHLSRNPKAGVLPRDSSKEKEERMRAVVTESYTEQDILKHCDTWFALGGNLRLFAMMIKPPERRR